MDSRGNHNLGLHVLLGLVALLGIVAAGLGAYRLDSGGDSSLLAGGVVAVVISIGLYPVALGLRKLTTRMGEQAALIERVSEQLGALRESARQSDAVKGITGRTAERKALRKAIREDIDQGQFEGALTLVARMSQVYGLHKEAEDFRDEIQTARAADLEIKVAEGVKQLDLILARHEWDKALPLAAKLQRLFPDSPRVRVLNRRIVEAREQHKHELERKFLEAAQRDDVDVAMELLLELDKYLTEAEAEPFRETARGVIGKKRDNLGVQFKLAVSDKEWTRAVRVGEQIIREFPNSKMANEVRGMLDLLRERAAGEQAARSQTASG